MVTVRKLAKLARHGCLALPFLIASTEALADVIAVGDVEINNVPILPPPPPPPPGVTVSLPDPFFSLTVSRNDDTGEFHIDNSTVVEMTPNLVLPIGEPFFIIGRNFTGLMTIDNATLTMEGSDDVADGGIGGQVGRDGNGALIMSNGARLTVDNPDRGDPGAGGSGLAVGRSADGVGILELV